MGSLNPFSKPKTPAPPPPVELPDPPPEAPTPASRDVILVGDRERRRAASSGFQSTILTGSQSDLGNLNTGKTILGG